MLLLYLLFNDVGNWVVFYQWIDRNWTHPDSIDVFRWIFTVIYILYSYYVIKYNYMGFELGLAARNCILGRYNDPILYLFMNK